MKKLLSYRWFHILIICLCIWLVIASIDMLRVAGMHEKPFFSLPLITKDDGGSGFYFGILYHFEIHGNFMPEDVPPHVTEYTWHLFGIPLIHA